MVLPPLALTSPNVAHNGDDDGDDDDDDDNDNNGDDSWRRCVHLAFTASI